MDAQAHWEAVFQRRQPEETSWYTPHLEHSLRWIAGIGLPPSAPILDVGAGESSLIADLLQRGFTHLTALDISESALRRVLRRMGSDAAAIRWIVGDATETELPRQCFALWHDRAVFHFLIAAEQRRRYLRQLRSAIADRGHVLISTFGPEGPLRCSGLEVKRYDAASLAAELGGDFLLQASELELHRTPSGSMQQFLHAHFSFEPPKTD